MRLHQVRDAMRNHACFAAPGARQQQERSFDVRNSRLLFRIQTLEEVHRGGQLDFTMLMLKGLGRLIRMWWRKPPAAN